MSLLGHQKIVPSCKPGLPQISLDCVFLVITPPLHVCAEVQYHETVGEDKAMRFFVAGSAACYFPIELQGEYAMQSTSATPGGQVQYSEVNITAEAILPIWGHCHRRLGNSVILTDR
jgi:hypothetical protein